MVSFIFVWYLVIFSENWEILVSNDKSISEHKVWKICFVIPQHIFLLFLHYIWIFHIMST